jgi:hypothetical protein
MSPLTHPEISECDLRNSHEHGKARAIWWQQSVTWSTDCVRVTVCLTQIEFPDLAWYIVFPLDSITVRSGFHSSAQIKEGKRGLRFSQRCWSFSSSGLRRCGKYMTVDMLSHTGWNEYPHIYKEGGSSFSMFASIGTNKKVRTTEFILNVKSLRHSLNVTECEQ